MNRARVKERWERIIDIPVKGKQRKKAATFLCIRGLLMAVYCCLDLTKNEKVPHATFLTYKERARERIFTFKNSFNITKNCKSKSLTWLRTVFKMATHMINRCEKIHSINFCWSSHVNYSFAHLINAVLYPLASVNYE